MGELDDPADDTSSMFHPRGEGSGRPSRGARLAMLGGLAAVGFAVVGVVVWRNPPDDTDRELSTVEVGPTTSRSDAGGRTSSVPDPSDADPALTGTTTDVSNESTANPLGGDTGVSATTSTTSGSPVSTETSATTVGPSTPTTLGEDTGVSATTSTTSDSGVPTGTSATTVGPSTATTLGEDTGVSATTVRPSPPKTAPALVVDVPATATFDVGSVEIDVRSNSPGRTSLSAEGPCSIGGGTVRFEHAGRCRISATQEPTDAFTAATANAVVTIGKGIRTVVPPSGFTWVDLPQAIGVRPANAPAPTFSSLTTDICSVTADGVIDVPDPSEGRSGRCGIAVDHPGNADWHPVATTIDVQIGAPAVLIRLAAGQETSFVYESGLSVTVLLDIVENDGGADVNVSGSDSDICTVPGAEMDWASETMNVDVDFHTEGTCILSFFAFGPGVYSYNIVLPAPIALTAR